MILLEVTSEIEQKARGLAAHLGVVFDELPLDTRPGFGSRRDFLTTAMILHMVSTSPPQGDWHSVASAPKDGSVIWIKRHPHRNTRKVEVQAKWSRRGYWLCIQSNNV